eukprot:TRINITY_DN14721_c0_g1_i1.p1 TRINITY_DN14721_c0_g1~~TRINITY_DN14721_c0_g1_i1.p1  ORF type:complete len:344 (-),score=74.71 TRINITY_DN14721_c0_g1_i1:34-1008(-)
MCIRDRSKEVQSSLIKILTTGDFQINANLDTKGAGLGLTISNSLSMLISGRPISFKSNPKGGSSFSLLLPRSLRNDGNPNDSGNFDDELSNQDEKDVHLSFLKIEGSPPQASFAEREIKVFETIRRLSGVENCPSSNSLEENDNEPCKIRKSSIDEQEEQKIEQCGRLSLKTKSALKESSDQVREELLLWHKRSSLITVVHPVPSIKEPTEDLDVQDSKIKNISEKYILAVDDNDFNLLSITTILKQMGYNCITMIRGRLAIAFLKQNFAKDAKLSKQILLILMDLDMPELNGIDTFKEMADLMKNGEIPVSYTHLTLPTIYSV